MFIVFMSPHITHILESSIDFIFAASIPVIKSSFIFEALNELSAASVVPPGEVTFFLNSAALSGEVASKLAAPRIVCIANNLASCSLKPFKNE